MIAFIATIGFLVMIMISILVIAGMIVFGMLSLLVIVGVPALVIYLLAQLLRPLASWPSITLTVEQFINNWPGGYSDYHRNTPGPKLNRLQWCMMVVEAHVDRFSRRGIAVYRRQYLRHPTDPWFTTEVWYVAIACGPVLVRVMDTPNEADLLCIDGWGFGYVPAAKAVALPWRPFKEVQ